MGIFLDRTNNRYNSFYIATKLNELKTVKIGDSILNIGRYYYDYQIFINQLDPAITRNQVI